jgi:hypothetical protein
MCESCGDTRLRMGGWMGPTPQRPYPDPCPDCWPEATKRDVQVRVVELIADGNAYLSSKYEPTTGVTTPDRAPTAREAWCAEYGHTFVEEEPNCIRCGIPNCEIRGHLYTDQNCVTCGHRYSG